MQENSQFSATEATPVALERDVRISVVIPCFNGERYLGAAIRSALDQTMPPLEVIVIDDGSTDGSAALALSFGPPVRLLQQPNRGGASAKNAGLVAAEGNWVAFLDADDLWHVAKLERQSLALRGAGDDVVCVFTDLDLFGEDGFRQVRAADPSDLEGNFLVKMLLRWILIPSCALVRADVARQILFPEGVRNVDDQQFFLLLRRQGRFLHIPDPLTRYRRWPGQMTAGPRHAVVSVRAHLAFLDAHRDWYTPEEIDRLRTSFADSLVEAHEVAFWNRDNATARDCRRLYYQVHPNVRACPLLFDRPLYPRWLTRLKDLWDHAWQKWGRRRIDTRRST